MGPGAPPDQVPVVVSPDGTPYILGTPTWVPLIDECMANGDRRNTCIENLPEAEREKLEAWEADRANSRRQLLEARTQRQ